MTQKLKLLLPALILSVLISIPFAFQRLQESHSFAFEIALQSSVNAQAQLYYDIGNWFREQDSVAVPITQSNTLVTYRFNLPEGDYYHLRFDPVIDLESSLVLSMAKIVDGKGELIKTFPTETFKPVQQIDVFKVTGDLIQIATTMEANDPVLEIILDQPFSLKVARNIDHWKLFIAERLELFLGIFLVCWGFLWLAKMFYVRYQQPLTARGHQLASWIGGHPHSAILGMAMFAMLLSSYPVVFFGKSFVSPNSGGSLLYNVTPSLPGYTDTEIEDVKGSDVGAMSWSHRPTSVVQHQAIFDDGEIPLWNRYNHTGTSLLGQGQSMLGDPLHLLVAVMSGGNNALAWDIKFLIAKLLLVYGLGLIVYLITRHLPAALIITGSSAFIGFFSFRFNHPAFFSLCYAPWILYCWLKLIAAPNLKNSVLWMLGLLLASWVEMNSGTAKEAYMLLIFLNLSGLITFLWSHDNNQFKLWKFFHLLGAGVLFVLISAPVWLTFLDAMKSAYTAYNVPSAAQANLFSVIGHFDEIFYRQFSDNEGLSPLPSTNFLILLGFLWSLSRLKHLLSDRTYVALGLSALISLALVFAIVPASLILKVPFLNNVAHIHNTFSCVLLIHLIILAGFGIKEYWEQVTNRTWFSDWIVTLLLFSILLMLYFSYTNLNVPAVPRSQFFVVYSILLVIAFVILPFIARPMVISKRVFPVPVLVVIICLLILHGRHGLHLETGIDDYVVNPQIRVDLATATKSPGIEFIKAEVQPYRTVAFSEDLFPGFNAALTVESIYGCDALMNPYYLELINATGVQLIWLWRIVIDPRTISELKPVYDALNVKYYLLNNKQVYFPVSSDDLSKLTLDTSLDFIVYHSDSVWPRAFFTDSLASYKTPTDFADMVKQGDGRPFAAIQNADSTIQSPLATRQIIPALDYHLTNNTTSFRIVAPSAGVIVLTEAFLADDFQVTLDGKPVDYFRVNHAFKGIKIDQAGLYTVKFSYWPKHFTLSLWLSLLGLIGLLGELGWAWRGVNAARLEPQCH